MGSARRVWLAIALAAIVAVAVVAPAFASYGGGGYITWTSTTSSPHGGYTTTTNKCAVCHAVHNAQTGGQLLLRGTVAGACQYCHVGGAGGYTQVYGGNIDNYKGKDFNTAHNYYTSGASAPGVLCTQCHQVHAAANVMTANTYLTQKLLIGTKVDTDYDTLAGQPLSGDTSGTALTKWCTKCHGIGLPTSYGYYNGYDYAGGGAASYTYARSHVMTIAAATYSNPDGVAIGKIAWADSTLCSSCHASGFQTSAWPHYTAGAARFLYSGGAVTSAPAGAVESGDDGVCLRCHRSGTGAGVAMGW